MKAKILRSIGGKQSIKGAAIMFLLYEVIILYVQTKGDFANGVLFYISSQMNSIFLLFFIIYFLIMFLLGRQAGFSILIKRNKYYFTGLAGGLIATAIIIMWNLLILIIFKGYYYNYSNTEIAKTLIRNFSFLIVPMILIWLWITYQIKAKDYMQTEGNIQTA